MLSYCAGRNSVLALAFALLWPAAAGAAIRQCGPVVSSEIVSSGDELSAKKQALDQWRAKAVKLGPDFGNWVVAAEKSLKCFKRESNNFECVAFGAPCVIQQNPNQKPAGPDRKGLPL
jgi:hypothetical protein